MVPKTIIIYFLLIIITLMSQWINFNWLTEKCQIAKMSIKKYPISKMSSKKCQKNVL